MMEMFYAQRVILGKASFDAVYPDRKHIPDVLKQAVADILREGGDPNLVPEANIGPTAT